MMTIIDRLSRIGAHTSPCTLFDIIWFSLRLLCGTKQKTNGEHGKIKQIRRYLAYALLIMLMYDNLFMIDVQVRGKILRRVSAMLLRAVQRLAHTNQIDIKPRPCHTGTTARPRVPSIQAGYRGMSHPPCRRDHALLFRLWSRYLLRLLCQVMYR